MIDKEPAMRLDSLSLASAIDGRELKPASEEEMAADPRPHWGHHRYTLRQKMDPQVPLLLGGPTRGHLALPTRKQPQPTAAPNKAAS